MSRPIRLLAIALLASFALGTAACGELTAPGGDSCSIQGSHTCADLSIQGSHT
jgi:hypothetical protein